jgi:hypothetical protein
VVGQAFSLKEELGASGSAPILSLVETDDGFEEEPEPIGGSRSDPILSLDTDDGFKQEENSTEPINYFAYLMPRSRPKKRTLSTTKAYLATLKIPSPEPKPEPVYESWGGVIRRVDGSPARSESHISYRSETYSQMCSQNTPPRTKPFFLTRSKSELGTRSASCPPFKPSYRSRYSKHATWFGTRERRGRSCSYSTVNSHVSQRSPTPVFNPGSDYGRDSNGYSYPSPGWVSSASEEEPIYGVCSLGFEYRKNKKPLSPSSRRDFPG